RRQGGRHERVDRAQIRRLTRLMVEQLLQDGSTRIGGTAGQHVVQRAAERIDVAADVDIPRVACLLGRNVVERAKRRAGDRQITYAVGGELPGQAQIDEFRPAVRCDDDV